MTVPIPATQSLCVSYARLVGAVFGASERVVLANLRLLPPADLCAQCDKPIEGKPRHGRTGLNFCSKTCLWEYTYPEVVCDQCGQTFRRWAHYLTRGIGKKGQQRVYCSHRCFGIYAGTHYGFVAHPENCRPPELKQFCKRGHPLDEANTYVYLTSHGRVRQCKACNRIRHQNYAARKQAAGGLLTPGTACLIIGRHGHNCVDPASLSPV